MVGPVLGMAVLHIFTLGMGACISNGTRHIGTLWLQLLCSTVFLLSTSLSSFLSARIAKGLLFRVTCWWICSNWQMVPGAVIMFNVVAPLGGAATTTLGGVAASTLGAESTRDGELSCPDIIVVSCRMAVRCFNLALADVGTVPPSTLKILPAMSNV